jgi:peptidoglycan/xylan/chitin deacetylase (PgdA/CDA1 family)
MNWGIWDRVEDILRRKNIFPLVAVIPDNRDPKLMIEKPRADFWDRVREWQTLGWSIGLHGYQHVFRTNDSGLLQLNRRSEFAGLDRNEQMAMLNAAVQKCLRNAVTPTIWVAPAHAFDRTTVSLLPSVGIQMISDGFGLYPWTDEFGVFWIPQQLWHLRGVPFGCWTVCLHVNNWSIDEVLEFEGALTRINGQIGSFVAAIDRYSTSRRGILSAVPEFVLWCAVRTKVKLCRKQ